MRLGTVVLAESLYIDWNNSFDVLDKAYASNLFVLIRGPKGTGKTTLVREFAAKRGIKLESINFSLRTRESHLVGAKTLENGAIGFEQGIRVKSMKAVTMLYLDEINSAEADVLLRLDEASDHRRQIVPTGTGEVLVNALKGWFVAATI